MRSLNETLSDSDIQEILSLYKLGVPLIRIAKQFSRHHSTIIYHVKRELKKENKKYVVRRNIDSENNGIDDLLSKQNYISHIRAKSYKDYHDESEKRRLETQETCQHIHVKKVFKCKDCGKCEEVHMHFTD